MAGAPTMHLLHQEGAEQHNGDSMQMNVVRKKKTD